MRDLMIIALFAALGALAAGMIGNFVLRLVRRRSAAVAVAVVATVAVGAMLGGTLSVAQAMFLSPHDLSVITTVCAISAVVSLFTAVLLGRRMAASSQQLVQAARSLGTDGSFVAPSNPATAELAALGEQLAAAGAQLNAARERERTLEASRRELVTWMSHDLRTPLAGLRAMAEALEDGVADDPSAYHRRIRVEVCRLTDMVSDLFNLSRIQAGALTLTRSRICLHDLIDDALSCADPLAEGRDVKLIGSHVENAPIEVDDSEMSRALQNLLANAIRHTPSGGEVVLVAQRQDEDVVITVTDECGGIPPTDLPRLFDAGWRGTTARTPPGGAGIGLAIVKGIVTAHAGSVAVHNVPGGCRFTLTVPALNSADCGVSPSG
ncbi:sensor histidine kinase KdpD [Streptomyces sp. N35]|uniref:sensor histidine kinase n=1 Tax=Streptomyces sp. N35 TaxID=2795730 RepID=UPI0018F51354|nr:HAMP domain-containing sensor histidine kinase [Streptomyces sp. N35]